MSRISFGAAALYSSSASHGGRAAHVKQRPLTEPIKIETEGLRWFAICTAVGCERRVVEDVRAAGFVSYCPLGRKRVFFESGRRTRQSVVREFPVFSRYIFAGSLGRPVTRDASEKIVWVLGDSSGPLAIPAAAIAEINFLELSGEWDASRLRADRSPFKPGVRVKVIKGPFASFPATVDEIESAGRIKVLIHLFGRVRPVSVDLEQVEAA